MQRKQQADEALKTVRERERAASQGRRRRAAAVPLFGVFGQPERGFGRVESRNAHIHTVNRTVTGRARGRTTPQNSAAAAPLSPTQLATLLGHQYLAMNGCYVIEE